MPYNISYKERNYKKEKNTNLPIQTAIHPLKSITVTQGKLTKKGKETLPSLETTKTTTNLKANDPLSKTGEEIQDPLSQTPLNDPLSQKSFIDPLSKPNDSIRTSTTSTLLQSPALDPTGAGLINNQQIDNVLEDVSDNDAVALSIGLEPWSARRTSILSRYTTNEKLSIISSFLVAQVGENVRVLSSHKRGGDESVVDKVKTRLEQLDNYEEGSVKETSNLTQQEFIDKIVELQSALRDSWAKDQRVKSLQIVIQCTKLLSDTSAIHFYPSKFVLITDLLDLFANFVYDRLKQKSATPMKGSKTNVPLPDNFKPSHVPEAAKETARNWFYKIASIRELMPRLYVEASILKCYRFIEPESISPGLLRLMEMTRGIADPLVACFARCYLARVGISLAPLQKSYLHNAFNDFISISIDMNATSVKRVLRTQKIDEATYKTLFCPALDWLLQCLCAGASAEQLEFFLNKCKDTSNSLLISAALSSFPPHFISNQADIFAGIISEISDSTYPRHLLCQQLGNCLVLSDPPEPMRLAVLNSIWQIVTAVSIPQDYMLCADAWAEFVAKHFGRKQINFFLGDVIKHITPDRAYENLYTLMQSVLNKIMVHVTDFQILFDSEQFLRFLDLFEREYVKLDVFKNILENILNHFRSKQTSDPVLIEACLSLLRQMHDSLNSLSVQDEKRAVAKLAVGFISLVDFGDQMDKELEFYVNCRGSMSSLESVLTHLIHQANALAMRAHAMRHGVHSVKSASFVHACVAFSFITIPSLTDLPAKLRLYINTGQVALMNACLGQADACFKTCITSLPEFNKLPGKMDEPLIIDIVCCLSSSLLMTPDNIGQGCLYLLKGLLNSVQAITWEASSDAKQIIFMKIIGLLGALSQPTYLYRAAKTDANDRLYGRDQAFLSELSSISSTLIDNILAHMKTLEAAKRVTIGTQLLSTILHHGDLNQNETRVLASNLWNLINSHKTKNSDVYRTVLGKIKAISQEENNSAAEFAIQLLSS